MKNTYIRVIQSPFRGLGLAILLVLSSSLLTLCHAQIAINTAGNTNAVGAILDLSNNGTTGNYGFLMPAVTLSNTITQLTPPITGGTAGNLSGLLVWNSSTNLSGEGAYYWNNVLNNWLFMGPGTLNDAGNGLSQAVNTVQLGGTSLIKNTTITNNTFDLNVTGSSQSTDFNPTGQLGIGNTAPNANAILDLTQTVNFWGLLVPPIPTAQLPAISTAAEDGLVVYNSTTNCLQYSAGGTWHNMIHGVITFIYTGAVQTWTVPTACSISTITVIASAGQGQGGQDGYGEGFGGYGAEVFANVQVKAGDVLNIVVGEDGAISDWTGGGGGGGTFVWDNSNTTYPLVVAGGGGGGSFMDYYSGIMWYDSVLEVHGGIGSPQIAPTNPGEASAGGTLGTAGALPATAADGPGGSGAGWNTLTPVPAATSATVGQGGAGKPGNFVGGDGATGSGQPVGTGAYGGGGGGGYNNISGGPDPPYTWGSGGGGGGYNGGGGGLANDVTSGVYGAGGGGSMFYSGASPYNVAADVKNPATVLGNSGTNGSVIIIY